MKNFYAVPGEEFYFDINHYFYEETISYDNIRATWGDLDWLTLSQEDGVLSGTVPEDFQYGRNIDALLLSTGQIMNFQQLV